MTRFRDKRASAEVIRRLGGGPKKPEPEPWVAPSTYTPPKTGGYWTLAGGTLPSRKERRAMMSKKTGAPT